jgi:hypothetical protein
MLTFQSVKCGYLLYRRHPIDASDLPVTSFRSTASLRVDSVQGPVFVVASKTSKWVDDVISIATKPKAIVPIALRNELSTAARAMA